MIEAINSSDAAKIASGVLVLSGAWAVMLLAVRRFVPVLALAYKVRSMWMAARWCSISWQTAKQDADRQIAKRRALRREMEVAR